MKALTEKQVEELSAQIRTNAHHAAEHERLAGETRWEIQGMSPDIAAEKPGAIERARELKLKAEDYDVRAHAYRREAELAQLKLDADQPFRDAGRKAARKVAAEQIASEIISIGVEANAALQSFVELVGRRRDAWQKLSAGGYSDLIDRAAPDIGHILGQVLAGAGMHALAPTLFQVRPDGPVSLAEHDADALRPILPANTPAVVSNSRRLAETMAQYRHLNAEPLNGGIAPRHF